MSIKIYVNEDTKTVRVDFGVDEYVRIRPSKTEHGRILFDQNLVGILATSTVNSKLVYETKPQPDPEPKGNFAYTHGIVNQPLVKYNGWWYTALSKYGVTWNEIVRMYPNAKEAK